MIKKVLGSKKTSWLALLVSVAGLLAHPEVMNLLPDNIAIAVSAIGAAIQAITKSVKDA